MKFSKIKTLILFYRFTDKLSYHDDWKDAFLLDSDFDTKCINIVKKKNIDFAKRNINEFEFIVILHSANGNTLKYLQPYKSILQKRRAKLLTFVGNEVNLPHVSIKEKIDFIKDIEAEFIGTQLLLETGKWLYEDCMKSKVLSLPHALNPHIYKPVIPQDKREIEIGARSNRYLFHLGDNDRNILFNFFLNSQFNPPLKIDISTDAEDRFNRDGWANFLNKCKATISNEAGSFYLERDDRTVLKIERYVEENARSSNIHMISGNSLPSKLWCLLPRSLRQKVKRIVCPTKILGKSRVYEQIDFSEIYDRFYKKYPIRNYYSKCVSSRHFDAIGTKTNQIMFKGRFNDILKENEHYFALERDFSNINDVMNSFNDLSCRKDMVNRTYEYVMENHTLQHRVLNIKKIIDF